jgi:predicted acetyltransferase
MSFEIKLLGPEHHVEFSAPARVAFGQAFDPERVARVARLGEIYQRLAAFDGDQVVGCAAGLALTMTTPGGSVDAAGFSMAGVLPTYRRRGILTELVRTHLITARTSNRPVSVLWAAESAIYRRFGYGPATWAGAVSIERTRAAFLKPVPEGGQMRLVTEAEAYELLPQIWDRVRAVTPGMMSRSRDWWEVRRIADHDRGSPLQRMVLFLNGRPEGYALYRFASKFSSTGTAQGALQVVEALGASPAATAIVWRYLFDFDLAHRIEAQILPAEHPIFHLVREPRWLGFTLADALHVRLVDVETALSARAWSSADAVTIEVVDSFCPWNEGSYLIDGETGSVERTNATPDLRMDAGTLAAAYLGGASFATLADAGEVEKLVGGAVTRADNLFRSARAPWCPEIF